MKARFWGLRSCGKRMQACLQEGGAPGIGRYFHWQTLGGKTRKLAPRECVSPPHRINYPVNPIGVMDTLFWAWGGRTVIITIQSVASVDCFEMVHLDHLCHSYKLQNEPTRPPVRRVSLLSQICGSLCHRRRLSLAFD